MMKLRTLALLLIACAGMEAQCVAGGLAVVVPKSSPTDGLSMAQLRKLVMGDVHTWPDKSKVTLVAADPDGAVFKCLITAVVRMSTPEYRKYLMNADFRGDEPLRLKPVDTSASAVRLVAASAGSFSVVEANAVSASSAVKVLAINGKHPGEAGYPLE